jgi:hypothetical protein
MDLPVGPTPPTGEIPMNAVLIAVVTSTGAARLEP